jgi:Ala-tRNA(Pro) deacylase
MFISDTVERFLVEHEVAFDVVSHPRSSTSQRTAQAAHVSGDCVAKAVLLTRPDHEYVMAVVPATHRVDPDAVQSALGLDGLALADEGEFPYLFSDCELGALPPLGQAFGIETVVDSTLLDRSEVYFEGGDHEHLVHLSGEGFKRLMEEAAQAAISRHA